MNKIQILLGTCLIFSSDVLARVAEETKPPINSTDQEAVETDSDLVKAVEAGLKAVKSESPQVHEDALRVWKNFKPKSKSPNYTYQYWGIRLILWLKDEKKMVFDAEESDEKVRDVFNILWQKKLISKEAVDVLTFYSWAHLLSLHGLPAQKKNKETLRSETESAVLGSDGHKPRGEAA